MDCVLLSAQFPPTSWRLTSALFSSSKSDKHQRSARIDITSAPLYVNRGSSRFGPARLTGSTRSSDTHDVTTPALLLGSI